MLTNRLFALAVVTALAGLVPWLLDVPLVLRLFGAVVTLAGLAVAYLTGSVALASRRAGARPAGGCGNDCSTCQCSGGGTSG